MTAMLRKLRPKFLALVVCLIAVGASICLGTSPVYMEAFSEVSAAEWANAFPEFLLGLLGVVLSLKQEENKWWWFTGFMVVTTLGVFTSLHQTGLSNLQSRQDNKSLMDSLNQLKLRLDKYERPKAVTPPTPKRPDVSVELVYPQGIALMLVNTSGVVLKDPKYSVIVWNLDLPDRRDPLPIPVKTLTGEFIRPREGLGPWSIPEYSDSVKSLVKKGDRLFGYITVQCPECKSTKYYWLYAVHGKDGWFSELPKGQYPATKAIFLELVPNVRRDPVAALKHIPASARRPIGDLP